MSIRNKLDSFLKEFNQKDARFDDNFKQFHESEKKKAEVRGGKDAEQGMPKATRDTFTPAEKEIESSYAQKISEVSDMGKPYLTRLHQEWLMKFADDMEEVSDSKNARRLVQLEEHRREELDTLQEERDEKISDLQNKPELRTVKKEIETLQPKYEALCRKEGRRETNASLGAIAFWPIIIFIALGEVAVNYFVFELMGESFGLTLLFSLAVGGVIALMGHLLGSRMKRISKLNWTNVVIIGSIALIIGGMSYAIANMREFFVLEYGLMPESLAASANWLFFFISILFFAAATWVSYAYHDSNRELILTAKELEQLKEKQDALEKQLEKDIQLIKDEYNRKKKEINKDFEIKVYNVEDEKSILRGLIQEIIGRYNAILHECQALERKINASFQEAIWNYRTSNLEIRSESHEPAVWKKDLELEMPMNNMNEMTELTLNTDINLN